MKFSLSRESLLAPMQSVMGAIEKRGTLPILANVLIEANENGVSLVGTDLEIEMRASAQDADVIQPGTVTVQARKLYEICRSLPQEAQVTFSLGESQATVRSGRSRFNLATLPAADFPENDPMEASVDLSLPQSALKRVIDHTSFSMANQDVRYYLNGLLFEVNDGTFRAVATDGHRLSLADVGFEDAAGSSRDLILPRKAVIELGRLLSYSDELVGMKMGTHRAEFTVGGTTMIAKLIDGKFPDYRRVVPQGNPLEMVADREALRQALVRASILSNEKYRGVRLSLSRNELKLEVSNPEQEQAEEVLEVQYEGDPIQIGFNVNYVLDALNAIDQEEVSVALKDPNSSAIARGVGDTSTEHVLMPMRL